MRGTYFGVMFRDGDVPRGGERFASLDGQLVDLHGWTQRNHRYMSVNGFVEDRLVRSAWFAP
jgi:hypothetical protein